MLSIAQQTFAAPDPTDSPWTLDLLGYPLLSCTIRGVPGPQGSKNTRRTKTGRTVVTESSAKVMPWRAAVAGTVAAVKGPGWVPLDGDVLLDLVFSMRRPAGAPKTLRVRPNKTPDLDKLVRSTLDGLKTGGLYVDDGRVVGFRRLDEFYAGDRDPDALPAGETGVVLRVWQLPVGAL